MSTTAKAKAHGKRIAKAAGQNTREGVGYAGMAAAAVPSPFELSKRSNIVLMLIGWSLLLVLIYLATARKPVIAAIGALGGLGGSAAKAWVAPVDPLSVLGVGSGSTPSSSSGSVPSSSGNQGGALAGMTAGRTDQGVDFSGKPGEPVTALQESKILGIQSDWYQKQPFVWWEVLDKGKGTGTYEYAAEQIHPTVKPGDVVHPGEPIGVYAQSGTGIERGYATASGKTLAQATTGYTEGQATKAGEQWRNRYLASPTRRPGRPIVPRVRRGHR